MPKQNNTRFPSQPAAPAAGMDLTTFMIASAMPVGANLTDVRQGERSLSYALINGFAKGTAAAIILSGRKPDSALKLAGTIGLLAGTGYLIDSIMKNSDMLPAAKEKAPEK